MRQILVAMILVIGIRANAGEVVELKLKAPRGVEIEAVIHYPDNLSPVPAVIIGSGQGYHMGLPLTEGLAKKIAEKGYVAIRFNWYYFTQKGNPSDELAVEFEDYSTVVNYAKTNSRIAPDKIIAAGKSLGTFLAYRYFQSDSSIKALIMMTPVCTSQWDDDGNQLPEPVPVGPQNYPELLRSSRPVVMTLGNRDSHCTLPMLFEFLKSSLGNVSTVVVEGDHSLNVGPYDDPAYKERNEINNGAATDMITHWVKLIADSLK